ncbi:MAG TPA: hypothetical protein DEV93_13355 [Chloroflexi bacterium]|nr:hypothetical protein [Chloroflexota bacterium]
MDGVGGNEYRTSLPGVGIFDVDGSGRVTLGVFVQAQPSASPVANIEQAQASATSWAQTHHMDLSGLQHRASEKHDRGTFIEYGFRWQAKKDSAWLPTFIGIDVYSSGGVADFVQETIPVTIATQPHVGAAEALTRARAAAPAGATIDDSTDLVVVVHANGSQQLVWICSFRTPANTFVPTLGSALVDAQNGAVAIL